MLTAKNDRELVPSRLRSKEKSEWDEAATGAEARMRMIERSMLLLTQPDASELGRAYAVLKTLHGEAFDWQPPDVAGLERLSATRMRQYVRAWINEWDLVRLDPDYLPQTETVQMSPGYSEEAELDG